MKTNQPDPASRKQKICVPYRWNLVPDEAQLQKKAEPFFRAGWYLAARSLAVDARQDYVTILTFHRVQ